MSVFTRNGDTPFKADRPIVCYISYIGDEDLTGETLRGISELLPDKGDLPYNNFHKDLIDKGYVDTYLTPPKGETSGTLYRCIIPIGTAFFISDDLSEICAKEVEVSNKVDEIPQLMDVISLGLLPFLTNHFFGNEGDNIIGGICLSTGDIINPLKYTCGGANAVGIVCNIHDNTSKILALKEVSLPWCTIAPDKRKCVTKHATTKKRIAYKDLNGYLNCKEISKHKSYRENLYPAISHCLNYSTGRLGAGRWFLGSSADMISAIRENMLKINVSLALLKDKGVDCDLLQNQWYWTSTELHELSSWVVVADNGFFGFNAKSSKCAVRPMTMI